MAPPNNRIWTLNDVTNRRSSSGNTGTSNTSGSSPEPMTTTTSTTRTKGNNKDNNNNNNNNNNPLAASYCQPLAANNNSNNNSKIKLCHIPKLPLDDVCAETLKRIHEEFEPIIRRRGYNVLSVSEMCCCGDGLDHQQQPRRRKPLRKQSANVWGYNSTRFGGRAKAKRSHTIHLRLREPKNHDRDLLSWEWVAGTMAHELSHCVHQNHGPQFYKLMEEILEEHWTTQVQNKTTMSFAPLNAHAVSRDIATPSTTTTTTIPSMPSSGGQRLGGSSSSKQAKSRLLLETNGKRLGGKSHPPSSLRDARIRAAESRRRQMEQTRRMVERCKEPCVIEIVDDDDDDEEEPTTTTTTSNRNRKPPPTANRTRKRPPHVQEDTKKPKAKAKPPNAVLPTTASTNKKPKVVDDWIDLTAEDDDSPPTIQSQPNNNKDKDEDEWSCGRCTFQNRPLSLVCDMCLSERQC